VTLESYVERIVDSMSEAIEPVTLVAHSRGGIATTAAAEVRPDTPAFQRHMHSQVPCDPVVSMDASHSAYFSKPDELADRIEELAASLAA
jgi:pimeloyl-ACP methyl ester carboxylesterase